MEQRPNDSPDYWGRLRRRVANWLQENAIYFMASFASAEAFLPPADSQAEVEREVAAFSDWLEQVNPDDFNRQG